MTQVIVKPAKFFSIANLDQPSNAKLNRVANALIYVATALMGTVNILSNSAPKVAAWVDFSLATLVVIAKLLVKFTAEPTVVDVPAADIKADETDTK